MKKSTEIAKDIYEQCGALLTVADIMQYLKKSRSWVKRNIVSNVLPVNNAKGAKNWFYEDIAKAICGEL